MGRVPADLNTLHSSRSPGSQVWISCAEKICLKGCLSSALRPHVLFFSILNQERLLLRDEQMSIEAIRQVHRCRDFIAKSTEMDLGTWECGKRLGEDVWWHVVGGLVGEGWCQRSGLFFSLDLHETKVSEFEASSLIYQKYDLLGKLRRLAECRRPLWAKASTNRRWGDLQRL